jgi:hypothetical protein
VSRRKHANGAARRIMSYLRANPEGGKMMIDGTYGYRVIPEEVWIEDFGQWIRLDYMTISGGADGYLYPGPFMQWRLRRFFKWWRDQVELPPLCSHPRQSDIHWSQDGYVSQCKVCKKVVHHGDSYDD